MKKRKYNYFMLGCLCLVFVACGTENTSNAISPTAVVENLTPSLTEKNSEKDVTPTPTTKSEATKAPTKKPVTSAVFSSAEKKATVKTEGLCEVLEQKDVSEQAKYNAFNRIIDKYEFEAESLFCIDENTGVIYFVNQGNDEYLYRMKDGETKLAVEMPVKEIYPYGDSIYFMIENHGKYALEGMKSGDIYCYTPATGEVTFVYSVEAMEANAKFHKLAVNEDGIYFSYSVIESQTLTQKIISKYYYHLPFGATEPVKDTKYTTNRGSKDYYISWSSGLSLVSRTQGSNDTIQITDRRGNSCMIDDMIYFATREDVNCLNLKTGEQQQYDFSEIIVKIHTQLTGEDEYPSNAEMLKCFIVMEEEIWAFDTNILYHLNLQTEEMTWYRLRDKAMHSYIDITALYTDGEELYCVSSRANGVMLQQDKM